MRGYGGAGRSVPFLQKLTVFCDIHDLCLVGKIFLSLTINESEPSIIRPTTTYSHGSQSFIVCLRYSEIPTLSINEEERVSSEFSFISPVAIINVIICTITMYLLLVLLLRAALREKVFLTSQFWFYVSALIYMLMYYPLYANLDSFCSYFPTNFFQFCAQNIVPVVQREVGKSQSFFVNIF